MAELKTKETTASVEDFLAQVADERRRHDCQTLVTMMREASGAEPHMWGASMVGFGRYQYQYASGRHGEFFIIGFALRKNDLTLYSLLGADGSTELLSRLGKHKTGKGCLYIKSLADVNLPVLREMMLQAVAQKQAP